MKKPTAPAPAACEADAYTPGTGWRQKVIGRTGRPSSDRKGQRRLHVQKHAWMHLRSTDRSDTMALRRRRIVISRRGSGRAGVGRTGHPGWSDMTYAPRPRPLSEALSA